MNDPLDAISIRCEAEYISVEGLRLSTFFDDWMEEHEVPIVLSDGEDEAEYVIIIRVLNVNDPPTTPVIVSPTDGSTWDPNKAIVFNATFDDPDIPAGQVLKISWSSNIDGDLHGYEGTEPRAVKVKDLSVGAHTITVTVSDGEASSSASVTITIEETGVGFIAIYSPWLIAIVVVCIVIVSSYYLLLRQRKRE